MRRRGWASTCFAFMLPKNKVGQVDLFARTEGTPRSPVCLQQGSLVYFSGYALHNPNPKYRCTSALPSANQGVRRQGTANCTITSALLPLLRSCAACVDRLVDVSVWHHHGSMAGKRCDKTPQQSPAF